MNILLAVNLPVSYTTIAVAVLLLLMFIIGVRSGFLRSVLKLVTAVGAIVAAIFGSPYLYNIIIVQPFVEKLGKLKEPLTQAISFIGVWLAALIVLKIVCAIINKAFGGGDGVFSSINRLLGGVLALAEGFLIVILITYFLNMFSNVGFVKTIIDNGQVDVFSKWLYNNNLVDQIFAFLSEKIPAFKTFFDSIKSIIPVPAK
ncbi:MAG: CvpA family protein [Clostridia bacterium]